MLAIAACLILLLGLINGALLSMAADDADHLTQAIAENRGFIGRSRDRGALRFENNRPVSGLAGPDSPDVRASLRYFTCVFAADGQGEPIAYSMDLVSRDEALAWARSLLKERSTGWTAQSYRYRVWTADERTYVTVVDQGRELLGFQRVLRISLIGFAAALILSFAALMLLGRRLLKPLETAGRERERFLDDIHRAYRVPVTVMSAGLDNLERRQGVSEETELLRRQLAAMDSALRGLPASADAAPDGGVPLADAVQTCEEQARAAFKERVIAFEAETEALAGCSLPDAEAVDGILRELTDNALKFARTRARLIVRREGDRLQLVMTNDTDLPDGTCDQVFDREVRLKNADGVPGAGLGLNRVRALVQRLNGRASASVADGVFTLRIGL